MEFYNLNTAVLYNFTKINKGLDFLIDTDYHEINRVTCTCTEKRGTDGEISRKVVFQPCKRFRKESQEG